MGACTTGIVIPSFCVKRLMMAKTPLPDGGAAAQGGATVLRKEAAAQPSHTPALANTATVAPFRAWRGSQRHNAEEPGGLP